MAGGPMSGGEMVVRALREHGVDRVFCVPGESFLPILDAFYEQRDAIAVVSCRHEHGAAVMAEACGKLTGRPGVCLVTRGPGACNASIGVHTAFQDSTPMVLIIGQVESAHRGREAFQEVDFEAMFRPLAKHAEEVKAVANLPEVMARAFHLARSGRQGPVVLSMPEDVLSARAAAAIEPAALEPRAPERDQMAALRRYLRAAERPMMLVGGGGWTAQARADIVAFARANDLPTACSFRRHDIFDNADERFVGDVALGPNPKLIERIKAADLLLVVGSRLGEIVSQGYTLIDRASDRQTLVHVHLDAAELGRVFSPRLGICADMAAFAAAARAMAPVESARWHDWTAQARADYFADSKPGAYPGPLDLGAVMAFLDETLPDDAIVTVDAGNFAGWPQRFIRFSGKRRLLGATNGAMGYAVPAAVSAQLVAPERVVVACVGDGGFGMTGQELATALQYGAKPIVLVFNNGMYGTIRMHQEREYPERVIGTSLANPDFAALAKAFGAHAERVEHTDAFAPAFAHALSAGRAALIELVVDPEQISTRATISAVRARARRRG